MFLKLFAIVVFLAVIALMAQLGSSFLAFIDVPSMILVFSVAIAALLGRHGVDGFKSLLDAERNQESTYTLGYAALIAGMLAFPLTAVSVLTAADSMKDIGPAMAVSMLSPFYGMIIYAVCFFLNPKMKVDTPAVMLMLPLTLISVITFVVVTWLIKS